MGCGWEPKSYRFHHWATSSNLVNVIGFYFSLNCQISGWAHSLLFTIMVPLSAVRLFFFFGAPDHRILRTPDVITSQLLMWVSSGVNSLNSICKNLILTNLPPCGAFCFMLAFSTPWTEQMRHKTVEFLRTTYYFTREIRTPGCVRLVVYNSLIHS